MFFYKSRFGKKKQKSFSKKAKRKIRKFLVEQKDRNEKMAEGTDPCGFREDAEMYARAVSDLDRGSYGSAKKILQAKMRERKKIKDIFGKDIANEGEFKKILPFVKELFTR